jgi:hypothetical protein
MRNAATLNIAAGFILGCGLLAGRCAAQTTGNAAAEGFARVTNTANAASASGAGGSSSPSVSKPKLHSVKLSWNPSVPATKLARDAVIGYIVYRSTKSNDPKTIPINSSSFVGTTFVDANVKPGTYYYVTRAVSASGRLSGPSNEVRVEIPAN